VIRVLFGDTGVGIHVNGIYQVSTRIFETQFLDVERVETLRGPQGTLYGRNTTGGVINVITAKADPSEFSASLDGTVGNYGATQARFHVNAPLSDTLALRIAGMSLERDGFTENEFTGNDVDDRSLWSGRLSLTWDAGDDTQVNFMYSNFEEDDSRMRSQKQACNQETRPTIRLMAVVSRIRCWRRLVPSTQTSKAYSRKQHSWVLAIQLT